MNTMNSRDIAGLTSVEQMRRDIQQFIGEHSAAVELMASRSRRQAVALAAAEEEHESPDAQAFREPDAIENPDNIAADAA